MTRIYSYSIGLAMLSIITILGIKQSIAKEYRTQKGELNFTVSAPAKSIVGNSNAAHITLDEETQKVKVEVLVNSFLFTNNFGSSEINKKVSERFNHYYMRSTEYPYVRYDADILNISEINFKKNGVYQIRTKGKLSIAGQVQEQEIAGKIIVNGNKIIVEIDVVILPYQYNIPIPTYISKMYFGKVMVSTVATLQ